MIIDNISLKSKNKERLLSCKVNICNLSAKMKKKMVNKIEKWSTSLGPLLTDVHPIKEESLSLFGTLFCMDGGFHPSKLHGENPPVISDTYARFNCMAIEFQLTVFLHCVLDSSLNFLSRREKSG